VKFLISIFVLLIFSSSALCDVTQSRDAEGSKIQGESYGAIRSASVGTKGFTCFSTSVYVAWKLKVAATASTDGAAIGFKMFYNESEAKTYPVSAEFFQWNNSPISRTRTINKVCLRSYSSVTQKTAYGLFQ